MPQLHLYVPEELALEIARRAEALGMSISLERAAPLDYEKRTSL